MSISTWIHNNRVETALIEYQGYRFLVYVSVVGSHRILLIDEIQSGVRLIPNEHPQIEGGFELEQYLRSQLDQLIRDNF